MRTSVAELRCLQKTHPSPTGVYAVAIVMDADGNLAATENGQPIVFVPPFGVANITPNGTVQLFHPDQHVSPGSLAAFAAVDKATVYREVDRGNLPKPTQLSSRRVGFKLLDVQRWLASRRKAS